MNRSYTSTETRARVTRPCLPAMALALAVVVAFAAGCADVKQATYPSPVEASRSLVDAIRARDHETLQRVLGEEVDDLISSGDEVADRARRDKFLRAYDEKHALVPGDASGSVTLVVGPDDWPMPIPIVKEEDGKWRFDTEAGKDEILSRRIGQNELDVIQVCQAFVDAEKEYAMRDPDGNGIPEYARKVLSDPGRKNGLYWETRPGEAPSPLGPFVADAVEQGYSTTRSASQGPRPYHGYYYRILLAQGAHAEGGAMDYEVNGKLIGGIALVAYPSAYGNSGIMTFVVNHQGVVYQRDLGEATETEAKAMKAFDPGPGWTKVEPAQATTQATTQASN